MAMAAAQIVKDDLNEILTCTVCLETFKDPRYLPCLHTFCESCINTYITSENEEENTGFKCPLCKQLVTMENSETCDKWSQLLPCNVFVKSMLNVRDMKGTKKICSPCKTNDNSTKEASFWCTVCNEAYCEQCVSYHKKFRMSSHHKIIPINELDSSMIENNCSSPAMCDRHPDKTIDVYCVDHSMPCCTVCATISHRKCENVVEIKGAASEVRGSNKTTDLQAELLRFREQINTTTIANRTNKTTIEAGTQNIAAEISVLKEAFINHLDNIEESIKGDLSALTKSALLDLESEETELTSIKATVDNWIRIMDALLKHGTDTQVLVEVNKLHLRKEELENRVRRVLFNSETREISFCPSYKADSILSSIKSFGTLTLNGRKIGLPNVDMQKGNVKILRVLDTSDGGTGLVSRGSGVFLGNLIFLTERMSQRVFKYDEDGVFQNQLTLSSKPCDIVKIDDTRIAVACSNVIYFVDVIDMVVQSSIHVNTTFWGFQYLQDEFITAYCDTLTWIDALSGNSKETDHSFGNTFFLYSYNRKDIVCGDGVNSVSRIANGKKTFVYSHQQLSGPRGIDIDFNGNIYICCFESENIHQITEVGKHIRVITANQVGIETPWMIRFQENSNRFLVTDMNQCKIVLCEIH